MTSDPSTLAIVMPNHVRGIIALYEPVGAALVVAQSEDDQARVKAG